MHTTVQDWAEANRYHVAKLKDAAAELESLRSAAKLKALCGRCGVCQPCEGSELCYSCLHGPAKPKPIDIGAFLEAADKRYWPHTSVWHPDSKVTVTAQYLRDLNDRAQGAECNEGYVIADLQQAQERIAELEAAANRAVEVVKRKRDELSPMGIGAKVCNEILAELGEG